MKPILFDSTLDFAQFAPRFLKALNDQPKERIQNILASDTLQSFQSDSIQRYNSFRGEVQENLANILPNNVEKYLIDVERQFIEHEQSFSDIKELQLWLEENETLPATEIAWKKFHEILSNPSPAFTYQDKSNLYCYYCISSRISDFYNSALNWVRRQKRYLVKGESSLSNKTGKSSSKISIDSWEKVLIGEFTLLKLKRILTIMPLPILDKKGILTEHSSPGNWAAVVAALRRAKKISTNDNAALYRLITKEFGKVASENQLKKGHENAKGELVQKVFNSTLALAGI